MNGFRIGPSDHGGGDATMTAELEEFVEIHRTHGHLDGNTGVLTPNGHRLAVACACGVTFHRWVTPREAVEDLAILARRN